MDEFPQIAGEIERCHTSVGKNVSGILVRYSAILKGVIIRIHTHRIFEEATINSGRAYYTEAILGAVTLTSLRKGAVTVSDKLMGTSTRDVLNLEGEVDVFKH